jgi:protein KTI12
MPCLILCGHPCAGKTRLAALIRERALAGSSGAIRQVVVINEASACPDQGIDACYATSADEKVTRGALKSAFDRCVSAGDEGTLVLLDSLNYIKGFRYELFCISKAAGQKHGIVWVLNESNLCKEWNTKRRAEGLAAYGEELLDELLQRFEPPDERNRWDKPLYRINVRPPGVKQQSGLVKEALAQSVYNMHKLSEAIGESPSAAAVAATKQTSTTFKRAGFKKAVRPPKQLEGVATAPTATNTEDTTLADHANVSDAPKELTLVEQIDQMLESFLLNVEALKEGMSTQQNVSSNADVLHDVASVTQQVCSLITAAQNKATTVGGRLSITLHQDKEAIWFAFGRRFQLPELRRLRRQYIQWVGVHPPEDSTERGIAHSFVNYIAGQQ